MCFTLRSVFLTVLFFLKVVEVERKCLKIDFDHVGSKKCLTGIHLPL